MNGFYTSTQKGDLINVNFSIRIRLQISQILKFTNLAGFQTTLHLKLVRVSKRGDKIR